MAIVGNQIKQLTSLLLLCFIIISAVIPPPWAEALIMCDVVFTKLQPCGNYLAFGGTIPAECCAGLKSLVDSLKLKEDRRGACECVKQGISNSRPEQLKRAQTIPGYCKVPVPFKIAKDVDCSAVNY